MTLQSMQEAMTTGNGVLHVYHPLGYPSPGRDKPFLDAAVAGGAQVLELGIPFSDPVADGPALQEASEIALQAGATPASALATLAALRKRHRHIGLVVMAYANTLHRMGWGEAAQGLADAGADGLIVPDMPYTEARRIAPLFVRQGVSWIPIISSTVPASTIRAVAALAPPFAYVASLGVTGRDGPGTEIAAAVQRVLKEAPRMPVAVGFGMRHAEDVVAARAAGAHGVVVGTALVKRIDSGESPQQYGAEVARLRAACA